MENNNRWVKWAFLEALTRTTSSTFCKVFGRVSQGFSNAILGVIVIGLVQVAVGFFVVRLQKKKLLINSPGIVGAVLFGTLAFVCTVITLLAMGHVDIGVFILLITAFSTVTATLIDWIFFKVQLKKRQWLALVVFILSGYFILDCPPIQQFTSLSVWIWLTLANAFLVGVNQGITKAVRKIDPFVKNFWGGLAEVGLGISGLSVLGFRYLNPDLMTKLTVVALIIGSIVVLMWTFNVLAFRGGAYMALKKLIVDGMWLALSAAIGAIFFDEKFTFYKVGGIVVYCIAFSLMNETTWQFFRRRFSSNNGELAIE